MRNMSWQIRQWRYKYIGAIDPNTLLQMHE